MTGARPARSLLRLDALAFDADPARALAYLRAYEPEGGSPSGRGARMRAEQARTRDEIVRWVLAERRPFERANLAGHLTASALVVAPDGRALLTHHKKLGRWLQLGGHCDGDANLAGVALREATEESGLLGSLAIDPRIVDVDIHTIPARPGNATRAAEPAHLHLDCRFVVHAPEGALERASEESLELGWFTPAEARELELDTSLVRLFATVFGA